MHKALYQELINKEENVVRCRLCPHECVIGPDKTGICRVRKNNKGILNSLIYSHHTSVSMDPIEKKPLYHFYPGSEVLSFGTYGCNLKCGFCQNWEISQHDYDEKGTRDILPEKAFQLARDYRALGIAYTYNEPLINYEWVFDTAKILHEEGLKNVLVTNGFISEEPLLKLLPFIHTANVDLKSFADDFYKKICKGAIGPVLRSIEIMVRKKVHIEVTVLVVPGENDRPEMMSDLVDWLSALNPQIPLHLSRYYPHYEFHLNPTTLKSMEVLRDTALKKMHYVYLGNVWEQNYSHTYCANPECRELLIERAGYHAQCVGLEANLCKKCGLENNIIC